jgi:hypothetical protein
VGHRVLQKNGKSNVLYVTAEQFMMEVIELLQGGELKTLREKYRTLDLLLVDDIQFLSTSESTQEEFFHTFNELHQAGKQIIMTSDRPPKMLTTLEDRLRSRFEWGLIADIKHPNLETRVAILKKKEGHFQGLQLSDDIRLYIAGRLKSNVRELEGFLKRVYAYAQLNNQQITLPLVKEIMQELLPPQEWEEEPMAAPTSAPKAPPPPPPPPRTPAGPDPLLDIGATLNLSPVQSAPAEPRPAPPAEKPAPQAPKAPPKSPYFHPMPDGMDPAKSICVAFFYPAGKEKELVQAKQRFDEIIKKHKLKFLLFGSLEMPYPLDDSLSYEELVNQCLLCDMPIAIVLGPPAESRLQETVFHQRLQDALELHNISLQMIPWDELGKDYRYLNLALDITLIRFKQKGKK